MEPKCPECEVQGMKYIVSKVSDAKSRQNTAWFDVVHCSECGHIYGVFAKHVFTRVNGPKLVLPD